MDTWENKYKKIKELGSGTSSTGFLVQDLSGNDFVIKTCAMSDYSKWEQECKREIEITSKLSDKMDRTYDIPLSELQGEVGSKYMLSSLIKGKELSRTKLNQLSEEEQTSIAKSLAQFMYQLHSQYIEQNTSSKFSSNTAEFFHNNNYHDEKEKIYKHLSPNIQDSMNTIFEAFDKDINIGRIKSTCHNDLIKDNLLYDTDKKKLGIIDFGDVAENDIYSDFANLMKMGQLGDQFTIKVINQYNKLQQKNGSNIHINAHSAKKYAIMKSFKSLKKIDKAKDEDKKIQLLKFGIYLKEYNDNKSSGLFKATNMSQNSNQNSL